MTEAVVSSRLFRTGGSLAVRIPKAWGLGNAGDGVRMRKHGRSIVIEPADEWPQEVLDLIGSWKDDPPLERMPQEPIGKAFRTSL